MAKAQVGDLIRILPTSSAVASRWAKAGEIAEVLVVADDGSGVNVKGVTDPYIPLEHHEYEIHRKSGEEGVPKTSADAINPQHYKQGRTEVIDIIEDAVVGADPFEAVCQANVLKYTLRYRHKNGVEDLKKAVWYAERLIVHLTQK